MSKLFENLGSNLLDLTLRNKLINFSDSKFRSIEIIDPSSEKLFSFINKQTLIYLKNSEDDNVNYSYPKLSHLIECHKNGEKSEKIYKNLKKNNDIAKNEKGINILYIVFGLLKWSDENYKKTELKSPLILVPVDIKYDSKSQLFTLIPIEDEIIFNPALKFKLEYDYGIKVPDFDSSKGLISYYDSLKEIFEKKNWSIEDKTYLGLFSFAKITMYKDLKANEYQMTSTPLVETIYNGIPFFNNKLKTNYDEYFKEGKDIELHNVVDADSSQIEAILEAKNGKSFVIQGPPGTGKSQTITNIIAELITDKKRVLFVSEKKAALDVVYNNLSKVGLNDFCLQIHSDKSNKKEFVQELYRVFLNTDYSPSFKDAQLSYLKNEKQALDNYANLSNQYVKQLNINLVDLVERYYSFKNYNLDEYNIKDISKKDLKYLENCQKALENLSLFDGNLSVNEYIWYGFDAQKYDYENINRIINDFSYYFKTINSLSKSLDTYNKFTKKNLSCVNDIKDDIEQIATIKDIPYSDINILSFERRKELISCFEEMSFILKKLEKHENKIKDIFDPNFFSSNYKENCDKFLSNYKNVFLTFTDSYKKDKKYFSKYINPNIKHINYFNLKIWLKNASLVAEYNLELNNLKANISNLTKYKYDLSSSSSLLATFNKLKTFDKNHFSFNLDIDNDIEIKTFINASKDLYDLIDEKNIKKLNNINNYFVNKSFNISNKNIFNFNDELEQYFNNIDKLSEWISFYQVYEPIKKIKIDEFVQCALKNNVNRKDFSKTYASLFYKEWLNYVYYSNNTYKMMSKLTQNNNVYKFVESDKKMLDVNKKYISNSIKKNINDIKEVATRNSGFIYGDFSSDPRMRKQIHILTHEANKKKAIMPIRKVFEQIPDLLFSIKPCVLMSPVSVATYLKYKTNLFDVVIFDEASQIFPWDAIGSISRAKSAIIVGDSKQMPPSNFFMSGTSFDEEDKYDEYEENAKDFESILDLATAVFPQKMLNWHYRSKSESLIAFSNHNFYNDKLVTFPSSHIDNDNFGIKFHYVANGVFVNRVNLQEANAVADLVYESLLKYPKMSIGVVCFSISQQSLLEDVIDDRRRKNPVFDKMLLENTNEPFFIKNLETVQGDERDIIIFSIGYGKDSSGFFRMNFGPLNKEGGERRLNVAITRAKYSVHVVSSIKYSDIDLSRTSSKGATLLKDYLFIAEKGVKNIHCDKLVAHLDDFNNSLEMDIAKFVESLGYQADIKVGHSDYKIDVAVKHPKYNDYVLAIECDGKTYHSAKNTRDRDRLRQEVLEKQGWSFYRIWSIDYFLNPIIEKEFLKKAIEKAVNKYDHRINQEKEHEENHASKENISFVPYVEKKEIEQTISNKNNTNNVRKVSEKNDSKFTDKLAYKDKEYIALFTDNLKLSGYNFIVQEREHLFAFKLQSDVTSGHPLALFWFTLNDNKKLVLRLKENPNQKAFVDEILCSQYSSEKNLVNHVLGYYSKRLVNTPKSENTINDDEQFEAFDNNEKRLNTFYLSYIDALQGKRIYHYNSESEILKKSRDIILDEICSNALARKVFKDKDDFAKHKYTKNCSYNIFDYYFDINNLNVEKAKKLFIYSIALMVMGIFKDYEKKLRCKIIDDNTKAFNSLVSIIQSKDPNYSKCEGITSNLSLISTEMIDRQIEEYLNYI